jgi:hypothetical protein
MNEVGVGHPSFGQETTPSGDGRAARVGIAEGPGTDIDAFPSVIAE